MKKLLSILAFIGFGFGVYYFYTNDPSGKGSPFLVCITKTITDYDCPGCGGQRAFHELLHGNLIEAAKLNLFIYFFAPLLLFIFLKVTLKPFGIKLPDIILATKWLVGILILMLIFTILRNVV
ncbi:MAG: hypothetical protein COB12_06575 [Flavobacterium sp.]|nr:MAG: hypothetical protein COB12_06575 [Flavobacterium sp.]